MTQVRHATGRPARPGFQPTLWRRVHKIRVRWSPSPGPPPHPYFLPSVGPFSRTDSDIFTQSGVFSLGMSIAQKVVGWQWQYNNWKEIRSWGITKYFLFIPRGRVTSKYCLCIFEYLALITMGTLFSLAHPWC